MESISPDPLQVPRFFARVFATLLAVILLGAGMTAIGSPAGWAGAFGDIGRFAIAGAPVLLLLLGTCAYLLRQGAEWRYLLTLWSPVFIAACIVPFHMLARSLS